MNDQRSSRRDQVAFWLGMASLLLALCPLAAVVLARHADSLLSLQSEWLWLATVVAAFLIAPAIGIALGIASLIVRINWRGAVAVAIGSCCLLAVMTLWMMLATAPDR